MQISCLFCLNNACPESFLGDTWCESTLLEDVAGGPLRAISAPPARIFAFCVFGPFEMSKNAFCEKMGNMPSIIFLILQNLAPDSYAAAVTSKAGGQPLPIGAKTVKATPAKAPAKYASGAIGAKQPSKAVTEAPVADASGTSQATTAQQSAPEITADSALQFLAQTRGNESFDEFQASKAKDQSSTARPDVGRADADDENDPAMQQALLESRQQSQVQPQDSDPAASSSAAVQRPIQQEPNDETQIGQDLETEYQQLSQLLATGGLDLDELERFRKVSQLQNTNKQRVAELCERQIHENREKQLESTRASFQQQQQAQSAGASQPPALQPPTTSALLGNLQPLQPARSGPKQIVKSAPDPSRVKSNKPAPIQAATMIIPMAIGQKGVQPMGPPPRRPPSNHCLRLSQRNQQLKLQIHRQ